MSHIFGFNKNKRIFLFLIAIFIIITKEEQEISIKQLHIYSVTNDTWLLNKRYIYYLDIHHYRMDEENIFQILSEENNVVHNITVSEIDESIIFENTSEIIKKETYNKSFHIKLRLKPKRYYYEVLIKKSKKEQNYFVLLIEPLRIQNNSEVDIIVSSAISNRIIKKKDISDGKIFSEEFFMDPKIERFNKFVFQNISLEKYNLILFIKDKGVSNFYLNNITSKEKRTRLFIIEKNTTKETEHIIYLSLLGPANKTKLSIMLDDQHDLTYIYKSSRLLNSFLIEKINCTKDYYIIEDYSSSEVIKSSQNYYLDINSIYGDYELIYYEYTSNNISNIFIPDNNTMEILNETSIKKINIEANILKFSCRTPTFLKIKYLEENCNLSLKEGQEKIVHLDKNPSYYENYKGNNLGIEDINREYKFYFGLYKLKEDYELVIASLNYDKKNLFRNDDLTKKVQNTTLSYYYEKEKSYSFSVDVWKDNLYFRLYLISNQYYKNVIEGVTKITYDENAFAFKLRKDIVFDYFVFKAYSFNSSNLVSLNYELKIVHKNEINNDKVMLGIIQTQDYQKKEIYLRFSNPYDKFNSKVKEDNFVYLLGKIISKKKNFPIYLDIRYYYNNSVITLEPSEAKILNNNKAYKISGGKNYNDTDKVLLNINKCNFCKNYSIETFYENKNNLISIENIIEKRTLLVHDNLFNNTKILLNEKQNEKKEFVQTSLENNGDLYMNYFPINENFFNELEITKDFSISYEDKRNPTSFKWNDYILNKKEFPVNYSIYILPKISKINSICQMSLIPPNISIINQNNYELFLDKGEYKISIIASIMNEEFPLTTYYNFLEFEVEKKYNIKLIIILSFSGLVLISLIIFLIIYCKKKKKENILDELDIRRKTRLETFTTLIGLVDGEEVIFNNSEEDGEEENICNSGKKKGKKGDDLEEKIDEVDFSGISDK